MKLVQEPSCNSLKTSSALGDVPKSAKQPSEYRLDDEALSRMDDEGGSNASMNPPDAAGKAAPAMIDLHNQDSSPVIMNSQVVSLQVTASIPVDCDFWSEDDGWKGLCKSPSAMVRGSSFEDAKKNMATELQVHIERILREHPERNAQRIA